MRKRLGDSFLHKGESTMLKILKEMGKVCENRRVGESLRDFHKKRFKELLLKDITEAKEHLKSYIFWTEKVTEMNKHIQQLHKKLF